MSRSIDKFNVDLRLLSSSTVDLVSVVSFKLSDLTSEQQPVDFVESTLIILSVLSTTDDDALIFFSIRFTSSFSIDDDVVTVFLISSSDVIVVVEDEVRCSVEIGTDGASFFLELRLTSTKDLTDAFF